MVNRFAHLEYPPIDPDGHRSDYAALWPDDLVNACLDEALESALAFDPEDPWIVENFPHWRAYAAAIGHTLLRRGYAAAHLADIDPTSSHFPEIDPDELSLAVAPDGRITAVTDHAIARTLTPVQVLWCTWRATAYEPAGRCPLYPALRPWHIRDDLIRLWGRATRRYGMPSVSLLYPAGTPQATLDAFAEAYQSAEADGVLMLPDTVAVTTSAPAYATTLSHAEAIQYADARLRAALLLEFAPGSVLGGERTAAGTALEVRTNPTRARYAAVQHAILDPLNDQLISPWARAHGAGDHRICPPTPTPTAQPTRPTSPDSSSATTEAPPAPRTAGSSRTRK